MQQGEIAKLADWLEAHKTGIADRSTKLDKKQIFKIIDALKVFQQPIITYFDMTEDQYDQAESDHKFTIEEGRHKLTEIKDRIMINHLDGTITSGELNFTYNHETSIKDTYQVKVDLNILTYGLEVLGAAAAIVDLAEIKQHLSKDAAMSLAIAAYAIDAWQKRQQ